MCLGERCLCLYFHLFSCVFAVGKYFPCPGKYCFLSVLSYKQHINLENCPLLSFSLSSLTLDKQRFSVTIYYIYDVRALD